MMIFIDNRSGEDLPLDEYQALAEFVLDQEDVLGDAELSLSLVTAGEIHELNREFRNINAPTDVLSFENDDELLGDVIICPVVAREHAHDFNSTFEKEMALMLTHGILHLRGYDHVDDDEAEIMEARENALLAAWQKRAEGEGAHE